MFEQEHNNHVSPRSGFDDCWNRIGVRGDHSCVELHTHLRCLNCPTYASAAVAMLDRPVGDSDYFVAVDVAESTHATPDNATAVLVFRVGAEWLALPAQVITEVAPGNTIHSLPHQSNPAVLGLANIRGALVLCVCLAQMLHTQAQVPKSPRLLVVSHQDNKLVFPVDEVSGIHRYSTDALLPAPTTLTQANGSYTKALLPWGEHKIGVLDCDLLFHALNRSLA